MERRPALGKGLSALIPETPEVPRNGPLQVDIDLLAPNEQQPRLQMDDAKLEELAQSIKANGIIQPILVRRTGDTLPHHRGRAALARGAARRPAEGAGRRPRRAGGLGEAAARARAHREHPAREPESGGRGARVSATRRRVRPHAGSDRRRGRQGPQLGGQLPAPAEAARGSPRRPRVRRAVDGTRARAAGAARCRGAAARRPRSHFARSVGARHRGARQAAGEPGRSATRRTKPRGANARIAAATKDVHTRAAEDRMRFALGTKVRIVRRGSGGTVEVDFASEAELNRIYEFIRRTKLDSSPGVSGLVQVSC